MAQATCPKGTSHEQPALVACCKMQSEVALGVVVVVGSSPSRVLPPIAARQPAVGPLPLLDRCCYWYPTLPVYSGNHSFHNISFTSLAIFYPILLLPNLVGDFLRVPCRGPPAVPVLG